MRSLRLSLVAGVVALVVAVPATASAQSPAASGYDETNVVNTLPDQTGPQSEVLDATGGGGGTDTTPTKTTKTENREAGANTPAAAAAPQEASTGSLPFTGADVGLVALMGAVLLGTGVVLRRNSRSQN